MKTAPQVVRVLLVEDKADDYALIFALVEEIHGTVDYSLDWETNFDSALDDLSRRRHDLYLVDCQLGLRTGLDFLRFSAVDPARPPIIVLTDQNNPELDAQMMLAGAADFLLKRDLDAAILERSLRYSNERHRLLQQLHTSEHSYRLLFDANPIPMWFTDPQSQRFLAVNDAAIGHYGYSREEFLKKRLPDLRAEESVWEAGAGTESTTGGHVREGRWRHQRKDGTVIDVSMARSETWLDGRSARLTVVEDVSGQRIAERALHETEQTLRRVLRDAADAVLVIDTGGMVRYANAQAPRLFGTSAEALVGSAAPAQLLGGNRDGVEFVDNKNFTHVVDLRCADSSWNGQPAQIVAIRDLTEIRAAQRQMRLLRRVMEVSPIGVTIVDVLAHDQPMVYVNPAFERITGYSSSEVLGHNCRLLQGEEHLQPELAIVRAAIASHSDCDAVVKNFRKDGTPFWNQIRLSPVRDERGRVTHYVGMQTDVTAMKLAEAERVWFSLHDTLTGLPKYAGLEARLQQMLDDARERQQRVAMLFVDLDAFHSVNDTMGYAIGDAALVAVASRLGQLVPVGAQLARFAGDEFVIGIAWDRPLAELLQLAQTICKGVADPLQISADSALYLSCSVGLSVFPDHGGDLPTLLRQADLANNRARRSGRGGVFQFTAELEEQLNDRLALGTRLRHALESQQFLLHFQPQISAHNGELTTLEALVRWNSPEFGLLPPRRFIPVAEDNGLIAQLGNWVLRDACRNIRLWLDQGFSNFTVSVNVSAAQMQDAGFVDDVHQALSLYQLPPELLELELTESMLMANVERAETQMHALKKLGISLALDDFGVGYSSLGYLQHFPLDKLKIDQSFVSCIGQPHRSTAIVRAIIAMGHQLEMKVIAEGVENIAQFGYLRRNHCDAMQGFLFCEALPAELVPAVLRKRFLAPELFRSESSQQTLLLLDDEENILRALTRVLRLDGYRILTAGSATEAFELLALNEVQVIISDQRMPGMSGTEFLSQVKLMHPRTVRMVLSGYTDLASVTEAINRGAIYKFLTKPWNDEELRSHVQDAFRRFG